MSDDYAKATAAGSPITIQGQQYRASKYGPRDLGDLQAWLKLQKPDPRTLAKELCAGLPDVVALQIWRDLSDEAQDWPLSMEHPEGNRLLLTTTDGATQVIWVTLRRYQPEIDLVAAGKLALTISQDELNTLASLGFPGANHDPKAETTSRAGTP